MVEGVHAMRYAAPAAVSALSFPPSGGGKILLPVRPAYALFASFKHIQVIPDATLEEGVPLYKLALLDSLIEQMAVSGAARKEAEKGRTPGSIDGVIEELSARLRSRAAASPSFGAGTLPAAGLVVDMVA
jgi:hypothetical protein